MSYLTHEDLFSGVGGFAYGFSLTNAIKTIAFYEANKFRQKVLKKNFPNAPVFPDVGKIETHEPVDIITSGDPCQKDSRANSQRDGNTMWPLVFEHIRRKRPLYVLRENVLGNIDTGTLERVESDLRKENYQVRSYNIPNSTVGAAHNRPRTWTLAYSDKAGRKKRDNAPITSETERWQHSMHVNPNGLYWVGTEPPVLRRIDDVPNRGDGVAANGDTINPIIATMFANAILKAEGMI